MNHPQLNDRHFFRIHDSGSGITSFIYCLLAAIYSNDLHRNVMHSKQAYQNFLKTLNLENIFSYHSSSFRTLKLFLRHNQQLNITIILYEGRLSPSTGKIEIFKHSTLGCGSKKICILRLFNFHMKTKRSFYFYLKNPSTIHNFLHKNRKWCCLVCFDRFTSKQRLLNHLQKCNANNIKSYMYPKQGSYIKFGKDDQAKYHSPLPIIGFADFETILNPLTPLVNENVYCDKCYSGNCKCFSYTKLMDKHELISYSIVFVDSKSQLIFEKHFCGEQVEKFFLQTLCSIEESLLRLIISKKDVKSMDNLTQEELEKFEAAFFCYICKEKFDSSDRMKIKNKDHCHWSGVYRGASCTWCNLRNKAQNLIPIFMHNFKGYDSKLLLSCLTQSQDKTKCNILASNTQNFRSISFRSFRFGDSLEHLPSSLDKLIRELNKTYDSNDFNILKQSMLIFDGPITYKKLKLITSGKGIYPYKMASRNMKKVTKFPDKQEFFNHLTKTHCCKEDYNYARKVWQAFNIANLEEYTKLYNHCDVLLLAEAFFLYRKVILQSFKLDPPHFYGIPSLSFNIMLKFSQIKLQHLSDPKMNDWFRQSIRGGVAFIKKRYEKGDSSFKGYGRQKFIKFLDATNLYGSAMTFKLPYNNFKFLEGKQLKKLEQKLKRNYFIDVEGDISYFVECDLSYPSHLHDLHQQWPLAPDKYDVTYDDLSKFSKIQLAFSNISSFEKKSFWRRS